MTWTVSFHFPSNNVVLLTRKYSSNKLQPIYNNSLTLNLFAPKTKKKKIYCKYCRNPLWYFHSFRSHFSIMVWNIQVCFIQNFLLSDFLKLHMKDEQMKVIFLWLSLCFYDSESPWTALRPSCCCLLRELFLSAGAKREECLCSKQGVNEPFSCL